VNNPSQPPTGAAAPASSDAPQGAGGGELLLRQVEWWRLLSEISTQVIRCPAEEIDGQIARVLERVGSFLGFDLVAISKFSGEGIAGEITHVWTAAGLPPVAPGFTELDFPWVAERLIQGHRVFLPTMNSLPPAGQQDRQTCEKLGVRSAYNWPLRVGGITVGCLGLAAVGEERGLPVGFDRELELLAELVAGALARAQTDRALRESQERLNLAAEAAGAGLWSLNLTTRRFWLTPKTRALFHFGADEVVTFDRFLAAVHPDDRQRVNQVAQRLIRFQQPGQLEYRIIWPDGSVRWIRSQGQVQRLGAGKPVHLMGVSLDITQQRQAEHETQGLRDSLAHSGRVSLLGQLASALAHELSQPLGAILRNAETAEILLREASPDLEELRAIVADILRDDRRAALVIDRMRSLLKRRKLELQPLELAGVIDEVLSLVQADAAAQQVKLACSTPPGLPRVHGDRVHLQQVLLNLLINAIEAMAECAPDQRRIEIRALVTASRTVEVRVCDRGPGIPPDALNRLFEPFFTTKPNGMGLGLAVSKTVIDAHQGRLWAENRAEGGACFCFTLPTCEGIG
jgi:PAS domain S-box-containing protein